MSDKLKDIDNEEKEIIESLINDEWVSDFSDEIKHEYENAAKNTIAKNKRINLRLSERDLKGIKAQALKEGLPYQSLITSIIRKYLSGELREISE